MQRQASPQGTAIGHALLASVIGAAALATGCKSSTCSSNSDCPAGTLCQHGLDEGSTCSTFTVTGTACDSGSDCSSGICTNGSCACGFNLSFCGTDSDCCDGSCPQVVAGFANQCNRRTCSTTSECGSFKVCVNVPLWSIGCSGPSCQQFAVNPAGGGLCYTATGGSCKASEDCLTGNCDGGVCGCMIPGMVIRVSSDQSDFAPDQLECATDADCCGAKCVPFAAGTVRLCIPDGG